MTKEILYFSTTAKGFKNRRWRIEDGKNTVRESDAQKILRERCPEHHIAMGRPPPGAPDLMHLPVPRAKLQEVKGDNRMALRRGMSAGIGGKARAPNDLTARKMVSELQCESHQATR